LEFLAGLKVSTDSSGVEAGAAEEKFARSVSKRYPGNKRRNFMSLSYGDLSLMQNDNMYRFPPGYLHFTERDSCCVGITGLGE